MHWGGTRSPQEIAVQTGNQKVDLLQKQKVPDEEVKLYEMATLLQKQKDWVVVVVVVVASESEPSA